MPIFTRHSLFWKYAAYFGGIVSALLITSGAVGGYFAYLESVAALRQVQRAKVEFAATEIENFMHGVRDALRAVAGKFTSSEPPPAHDMQLEIAALLRHHPEISELHWIGPDGAERAMASRFTRNVVDPARDWSEDPRFAYARAGTGYVGPVYFRKETEPYVSMAAAAGSNGSVLSAEVNLKYVWDVVSQLQLTRNGTAYVVDREGLLISHPDIGLVLRKTDLSTLPQVQRALNHAAERAEDFGKARDIGGQRVVSTAAPIGDLGWVVFAEQPRDEAFRPVYASVARSVGLVLLGMVAAIAASMLLARRMVQPIREIETRARQIGEGHFDHRIALHTDDELGALANQFNRMAGRLQETYAMQEMRIAERTRDLALANEAKTRFLAAASHDLRQPIHALALFVAQLRGARSPADANSLLQKIERSVEALNELLEALLDLSKLDVGAVTADPRPLALHDLLARLTAEFAPSAEAKGLALTLVPTSLWVRSDPLLLQRILLNVISNALRYTQQGRILIGCLRRGDDVVIVVADTGVGIASVHLPHVFQEFYRVAPTQHGNTGLGLGLAIVNRLAKLLDHKVTVDSAPGKGTVVRIHVRRARAEVSARRPEAVLRDSLQGARVLILDDDPQALDAMQGLLAQWGCDVVTARDGDEAIEHARGAPPDVILSDLRLADGETGIRVVERLKRECGSDVACAFVTGESAPETLAEVRKQGYLIVFKPTTPAKLRAILEHLSSGAATEVNR